MINWQELNLNNRRNHRLFSSLSICYILLLKFHYLFGLLQGDGLDCPEELVLRVLSGLLREHIRSIFKVLWQASQSRLPLHLVKEGRGKTWVKTEKIYLLSYPVKFILLI